jgi:hypothetical protein
MHNITYSASVVTFDNSALLQQIALDVTAYTVPCTALFMLDKQECSWYINHIILLPDHHTN